MKSSPDLIFKDDHAIKEFMIDKYEKKKYYTQPSAVIETPSPPSLSPSNKPVVKENSIPSLSSAASSIAVPRLSSGSINNDAFKRPVTSPLTIKEAQVTNLVQVINVLGEAVIWLLYSVAEYKGRRVRQRPRKICKPGVGAACCGRKKFYKGGS